MAIINILSFKFQISVYYGQNVLIVINIIYHRNFENKNNLYIKYPSKIKNITLNQLIFVFSKKKKKNN